MVPSKTRPGKFLPYIKILEAFVVGLEAVFSGDFASWCLKFFLKLSLQFSNRGHSLAKAQIYHSILLRETQPLLDDMIFITVKPKVLIISCR